MPVRRSSSISGHLLTYPSQPTAAGSLCGLQTLHLPDQRYGLLYVPPTYQPERSLPLVLMLHGAGGDAAAALALLEGLANAYRLILLAVTSQGRTWDVIVRNFSPDMAAIDQALAQTFNRYAIDSHRVAIVGFSNGASHALSLGLMNNQAFSHIIAFSFGFVVPAAPQGTPGIFIAHGTQDPVLSIDRCSRRIVLQSKKVGCNTFYQEFERGHTVPKAMARQAIAWLTSERSWP